MLDHRPAVQSVSAASLRVPAAASQEGDLVWIKISLLDSAMCLSEPASHPRFSYTTLTVLIFLGAFGRSATRTPKMPSSGRAEEGVPKPVNEAGERQPHVKGKLSRQVRWVSSDITIMSSRSLVL